MNNWKGDIMKFKIRFDKDDMVKFCIYVVILFIMIAILVANLLTFANTGSFSGFNFFIALSREYFPTTIVIFLMALGGLVFTCKSYFFEFDKGFGFTTEKKLDGYNHWCDKKTIQKELKPVQSVSMKADAGGIPLINDGKTLWVDDGQYHNLIIGSTGSGKTQCIIFPMVQCLAKHDESMVITDPKGEIYEQTSEMLRRRGYNIVLLNFRNPGHGNAWNPLTLPYRLYNGGNQDKAIELLDDLALNILYDDSNKNQDPFWEKTSADYFSGVALGLFEDAKEEEININSISLATTVGEDKFGGSTYIKEYFAAKDPTSAASINASSKIMAPNETKGSILSVFKQKVKLFASRDNLSEMLSHSDINLEAIGEKPTAVFIVIQDEKKTYHSLVTIFLKQVYETLISTAQRHGGKLPIRTNFLLDEFANMPPLKDVTTMITAARSRKIRFTMIIQNFAQLDSVYGKEDAETIRGNCGNIIYLITTELKALEEISKMCGEVKSKKDDKTASTPLVTVSDLQRMKQFEVIIMRMRKQPFKTKFTPYFKLDWGRNYPKAKYPVRQKRVVHVFDIKEFVKSQKKKKLLEMMKSAEEEQEQNRPEEKEEIRNFERPNILPYNNIEDEEFKSFLANKGYGNASSSRVSEDREEPFTPMTMPKDESIEDVQENKEFSKPDDDDDDDDLGFDVDEIVRKIDAKIAELEEEERREKEEEERKRKEAEEKKKETQTKPNTSNIPSLGTTIELNDEIDDDDFFDDFFDN